MMSLIKSIACYGVYGCLAMGVFANVSLAHQESQTKIVHSAPALNPLYSDAIKSLKNTPKINKAFAWLEQANAQNIKDLITINEIPAPPFAEKERALFFAQMLRDAGLDSVELDEVGNVLALRKGAVATKTTALVAHLDTVFPAETDVTVKVEGNRYTAPGISDNARSLVALLSLVRVMEQLDIQTQDNILFVASVGEEGAGDLRGVKHLFRQGGPKIDSFIAIDAKGNDQIIYKAVGSNRYRVTFSGPGGHSWGHFGLPNPHHALGRAIENFAMAAPKITNSGSKASYSVGRIGGGTSINSIAFESWFEVDMRSVDAGKLKALDGAFKRAVALALEEENLAKKHGDDLSVDIKTVGIRPAGINDPNGALVQQTMAAMLSLGIKPIFKESSTDANIPISLGIPAITVSQGGDSDGAHSPDEWWENKDSHLALQSMLLVLLAQVGLNK